MDSSPAHINKLLNCPVDFMRLADDIPLGILILDKDRHLVFLNHSFEAISGFSMSSARGIHCRNILRSKACINDCPVLKMNKDRDFRPVSCTSDMINLDRQRFPIRITSSPLFDTRGDIAGFMETIEDIRLTQTFDAKKNLAYSFANIIGRSRQMEKIFQTLPVLAQSDASVLITGETGTGKDLVAEAIHRTSGRASGPFIKINCGALPATLLESEIFGHKKGAFTGAVENKPGRFRLAHNGTIFLTEIGDLPLPLQVKLLTFLDDKIIYPLGGTKGFRANVRMIAATHRNLEQMVKQGKFRKDLLFRLNVARIHLPPLRERPGDIRLLLDHFFNKYKSQLEKQVNGFSPEALHKLVKYRYEGNIRELKNIVEYAVNIASKPMIGLSDLPAYITDNPPSCMDDKNADTDEIKAAEDSHDAGVSRKATWRMAEKQMILDALVKAKGRKIKAAQILGWGRSTLWRKIKLHQIE